MQLQALPYLLFLLNQHLLVGLNSSSTSSDVNTLGTLFSTLGDCIFSVGSCFIFFTTELDIDKKILIDAKFLEIVDVFLPISCKCL